MIYLKYAVAYTEVNGRGFSDNEPYINTDFEDTRSECLKIASNMIDDGYNHVTPFIIKEQMESYDWKYVNKNKLIVDEI